MNHKQEQLDYIVVAPIMSAALGNEDEGIAVPALWEALLGSMSAAKGDFWNVVDPRKSFFPQLCRHLR